MRKPKVWDWANVPNGTAVPMVQKRHEIEDWKSIAEKLEELAQTEKFIGSPQSYDLMGVADLLRKIK